MFSSKMFMNNNKITKIDNIYEITNGCLDDLKQVDPNQIGNVVDENGNTISEITPIIMIINQHRKDVNDRLEILRNNGGDFDKKINYYRIHRSANNIMDKK